MGNRLKDYLNADEMEQFLILCFIKDAGINFLRNWKQRGNLSKAEETAAKYMMTYSDKFLRAVMERLDVKAIATLTKRLEQYTLCATDEFTRKKLKGEMEEDFKVVHMGREQFEDWCEEILNARCKGCIADHKKCELHDLLFTNFVAESGYNLDNCRYAYTKE